MDAKAMQKLSYGLFILSAHCGKRDNACIINTGIQVASSPDRITISVNKNGLTHDMLGYSEEFTLSVLSEDAPFSLFERFGFHSGNDVEKFDGFDACERASNGVLAVTTGTNAYFCCHIEQRIDLGSHTLIIATITDAKVLSGVSSATYAFYHAHIKPRPAAAPKTGKTVWRCTVCGYEYEGEELPDDFICPICKHGKEDFEKVLA